MENRKFRKLLPVFISIGLISGFVYYLFLNSDKYLELLNLSVPSVVTLAALSLTFPVLNGMQNSYLYRCLGTMEFSHKDGFLLSAAASLANQLPIPGGFVSKGFYLKRKHNLSYSMFASSILALYVCYLALNGLIGLVILMYWYFFKDVEFFPSLMIGFGLMTACIFVFWLHPDQIKLPNKVHKSIHQAIEGWMIVSRSPTTLIKVISLQVIMIILLSIRYWLAFHMLSQEVTIGQMLLLSNATILTQMVSIAPGGFGVREVIVGAVASALHFDFSVSVVAVGLDRIITTPIILIVGSISAFILGDQLFQVDKK